MNDFRTDLKGAAPVSRRALIGAAGAVAAFAAAPKLHAEAAPARPAAIKAVAFDGFTLFDPAILVEKAEALFPGRGAALAAQWRSRLFEYAWLRAAAGRYADFSVCVADSLAFAAAAQKIEINATAQAALTGVFMELTAFPDVAPALHRLKAAGLRLAILANLTPPMLSRAVERSGLADLFDHVISTDQARTYKPDARAYQLGVAAFRLPREATAFLTSGSWDAAGADWFGFPTYWLNRAGAPAERLGQTARWTGATMTEFADVVIA